ncbi:MAG: hypothetical protein WD645_07125 [Dehalococcoidia bacterium]
MVAIILFMVFVIAVTPQGRAAFKTAGLVAQVLPAAPVQPLEWFTAEPERERVTYAGPNGPAEADLYRVPDGDGPKAAMVLFLGVSPAGREEERVINLSRALARAGFVVLVPWSENMVAGRVDSGDVELLVSSFQYLQGLDFVDAERIGSAGFCVGSSLLTVAAADPRIRDDVRFINFFSGYYDGRDYLAQFSAMQAYYEGEVRPWDADPLAVEVFQRMLIERTPRPSERAALAAHFDGEALLGSDAVALLSPEAQAAYHLLTGSGLEQARSYIAQLPDDTLRAMDELSPSHYVDEVTAPLWIMHDVDDTLAPIEESRRLHDAVGGRPNVTFTEFELFQHVDPDANTGFFDLAGESWKLVRHLYRVVRVAT